MENVQDEFGVGPVFAEYGDYMAKESAIREQLREKMKELDNVSREIYALLQRVHRPGGIKTLAAIVSQVEEKLVVARKMFVSLDQQIPKGSYWKYSSMWSSCNSWFTFLIAFMIFLKEERLATQSEVSDLLELSNLDTLKLDVEEYLLGLCHMSNELSRLSVNAVTSEDYGKPVRIAEFLNSLYTGFRMLNLKNDGLRKKFDSIKYDLKKVEEVVYDLSIRGLNKPVEEIKTGDTKIEA